MAAAREISSVVNLDMLVTYKIDGDCSYSITVFTRALRLDGGAADAQQAEAVRVLKAGDGASKADINATVEALKALKVKAGVVARRLKQALGVGTSGAIGGPLPHVHISRAGGRDGPILPPSSHKSIPKIRAIR
uniref:Putative s15/NS1, RNA-biding n=1 Tax=Saccharum hybrid cultivar R570 TaxID=131158 RepID=A0A059Q326_9POAL|nr:putative s15/NS1, RNA-biding [Saccharum hybrid cultivar R570]AGT16895.1 hypothetical protein SHCRBa_134_H07_F_30 [Saccharum hybrid cultivar R570]